MIRNKVKLERREKNIDKKARYKLRELIHDIIKCSQIRNIKTTLNQEKRT